MQGCRVEGCLGDRTFKSKTFTGAIKDSISLKLSSSRRRFFIVVYSLLIKNIFKGLVSV